MKSRKNIQILCLFLSILALCAAQRRLTRRPILRHTTAPYNNLLHRTATTRSPISIPKAGRTQCKRVHELLPDLNDPSRYKICIPAGRNWIVYTYSCPFGSAYDKNLQRCVAIPTQPPTTPAPPTQESVTSPMSTLRTSTRDPTYPSVTLPPQNNLQTSSSASLNELTKSPHTTTDLDTATETVVTDYTSLTPESSSSSEEIFLTHPENFLEFPQSKPHSSPVNPGSHPGNYKPVIISHIPHQTTEAEYKLTTWQTLSPTSVKPLLSRLHKPLIKNTLIQNLNSVYHQGDSLKAQAITSSGATTSNPINRWKPSTILYKERFPGLRPSRPSH